MSFTGDAILVITMSLRPKSFMYAAIIKKIIQLALISTAFNSANINGAKLIKLTVPFKILSFMKKVSEKTKPKPKEVTQLGKRIKELRQAKGYTSQETFAYDNEYTLSYYSRLERGEDMRFSSLVRVCKALNITLEDFFKGFN